MASVILTYDVAAYQSMQEVRGTVVVEVLSQYRGSTRGACWRLIRRAASASAKVATLRRTRGRSAGWLGTPAARVCLRQCRSLSVARWLTTG